MVMKIKTLAFLMLFGALSFAQTTTYTGVVKDLSGAVATSGNVTFTLTPKVDTTISGNARFVPTKTTCSIISTGHVMAMNGTDACIVTSNTALVPSGTSYTVCLQPGFVVPGSCFVDYAITSTKDISTVVPTPAR